jgi:hypothetical protein
MKRFLILILLPFLVCCTKKPSEPVTNNSKDFKTEAIVLPPDPDPEPIVKNNNLVKEDIKVAKQNVDGVLDKAKKSDVPIAKEVIPPLTTASNSLANGQVHAEAVNSEVERLKMELEITKTANAKAIETRSGEIEKIRGAALKDTESRDKAIAERDKKIADLENEDLQWAKIRLGGIGLGFLLLGAGSIVAMIMLGFAPGKLIAMCAFPMGLICIALAALLTKLIFWTEVGLGICLVFGIIYAVWHTFWYHPPEVIHNPKNKKVIPNGTKIP